MRRPTGNFRREDEDWLRHLGIAPYDHDELAYAQDLLARRYTTLSKGAVQIARAAEEATAVFEALNDHLIALDVEVDCEAATLLDPHAPAPD